MATRLSSRIGTTVLRSTVAETVRAYVPKPLPPHPPLDLARLLAPIEHANQALGRLDGTSALRVHAELKRSPLLAVPLAAKKLAISQPTVQKSLDHLTKLGIVKEITGKRRSRLYEYTPYLRILDEGTEPLQR